MVVYKEKIDSRVNMMQMGVIGVVSRLRVHNLFTVAMGTSKGDSLALFSRGVGR